LSMMKVVDYNNIHNLDSNGINKHNNGVIMIIIPNNGWFKILIIMRVIIKIIIIKIIIIKIRKITIKIKIIKIKNSKNYLKKK